MTYDFYCRSCNEEFEVICASEERNNNWQCIACSSNDTYRKFTTQRHFNIGSFEQKSDSYWDNAEKERLRKQKIRFKEHSEKYNYDKEYRLRENRRLHSRGIPKCNLPEGELI